MGRNLRALEAVLRGQQIQHIGSAPELWLLSDAVRESAVSALAAVAGAGSATVERTVAPNLMLLEAMFRQNPYRQRPKVPWAEEHRLRGKLLAYPSRSFVAPIADSLVSFSLLPAWSSPLQFLPEASSSLIPRLLATVGEEAEVSTKSALSAPAALGSTVAGDHDAVQAAQLLVAVAVEEAPWLPVEADLDEEPT